ncbi:hypothetical protein ZWY2020_020815 [Hordeum vulgare]|nr:hypothetical protein ZWY2020_020815 [Hordeum vulgare]
MGKGARNSEIQSDMALHRQVSYPSITLVGLASRPCLSHPPSAQDLAPSDLPPPIGAPPPGHRAVGREPWGMRRRLGIAGLPGCLAKLPTRKIKLAMIRRLGRHNVRKNCSLLSFTLCGTLWATFLLTDCSLALTGPTCAIVVSYDPTYLEVFLKVKGTTESEDKDLSALVVVFRAGACPQSVYPSRLSTLEIKFDHIYHSVEATVFIRIIDGSWSDGFRGVFSAASGSDDNLQVKLLDFGDGGLPVDANGVITLSRPVVSVKLERNLKVSVMAFPISKGYAIETSEAILKPHRAGVSPPDINLCWLM